MIILCPLCLRAFTVAKEETMTSAKMCLLSKLIYNHIAQHYVTAKSFACSNCSLCFIDKDSLDRHIKSHHNPLEIRNQPDITMSSFLVTREEEEFCVRALPNELFIANKKPNLSSLDKSKEDDEEMPGIRDSVDRPVDSLEPVIVMRPSRSAKNPVESDLSSGKLIQYMSRMKRADGIIPNRSVLLTPNLKPAKCCECCEPITVDHFVGSIACKLCKHLTYCPRAAMRHKTTKHPDD